MSKTIAPDVEDRILDRCTDDTILSTYTDDDTTIELHAPYEGDGVTVWNGVPFVTSLKYTDATDTPTIDAIGYFDSQPHEGRIGFAVYNHNYLPLDLQSDDEESFVKSIRANQHLSRVLDSHDWSETIYTGEYIIQKCDPDEIRDIGNHLYPNDKEDYSHQSQQSDFDADRRDELIEAVITASGRMAAEYANLPEDRCYTVRNLTVFDFRERAIDLFTESPPVTQAQAVVWALAEMGLNQTTMANLRQKTQPTIHSTLKRAATHYFQSKKTADAFVSPTRYMGAQDIIGDVRFDIEDGIADRTFEYRKDLKCQRLRCPECGYDAGEWDGGLQHGDWVDTPQPFYIGKKTYDSFQNRTDPRYVECYECNHEGWYSEFEEEWVRIHGTVEYDGPEPDPAPY